MPDEVARTSRVAGRKAAMRDASWHDRPDCYRPKRFHVLSPDGEQALCGRRMVVNNDSELDLAFVHPTLRCQRSGCRQAWPRDIENAPTRESVTTSRSKGEGQTGTPHKEKGRPMFEWNVYVNGRYVGTVDARTEEQARLAAWSRFDPPEDASISVAKR